MEILDKAQQFVEHSTLTLTGEEDFIPFIIVTDDSDKEFFVGFTSMPSSPESKDSLADMIMALCIVYGAAKAAFGSTAWYAEGSGDLPPSQRPDRKEIAVVSAATCDGIVGIRVAPVVRESNKVGVGLWEEMPTVAASGRFAEALHMGLKLSRKMPPATREFLRGLLEAGMEEEILRSTAGIITEARRNGLSVEKGDWEK